MAAKHTEILVIQWCIYLFFSSTPSNVRVPSMRLRFLYRTAEDNQAFIAMTMLPQICELFCKVTVAGVCTCSCYTSRWNWNWRWMFKAAYSEKSCHCELNNDTWNNKGILNNKYDIRSLQTLFPMFYISSVHQRKSLNELTYPCIVMLISPWELQIVYNGII